MLKIPLWHQAYLLCTQETDFHMTGSHSSRKPSSHSDFKRTIHIVRKEQKAGWQRLEHSDVFKITKLITPLSLGEKKTGVFSGGQGQVKAFLKHWRSRGWTKVCIFLHIWSHYKCCRIQNANCVFKALCYQCSCKVWENIPPIAEGHNENQYQTCKMDFCNGKWQRLNHRHWRRKENHVEKKIAFEEGKNDTSCYITVIDVTCYIRYNDTNPRDKIRTGNKEINYHFSLQERWFMIKMISRFLNNSCLVLTPSWLQTNASWQRHQSELSGNADRKTPWDEAVESPTSMQQDTLQTNILPQALTSERDWKSVQRNLCAQEAIKPGWRGQVRGQFKCLFSWCLYRRNKVIHPSRQYTFLPRNWS